MQSLGRELKESRQMERHIALWAIVFLFVVGGGFNDVPRVFAQAANGQSLGGERGLKLCNTTGSRVGAAIGYKTAKGWISEGWWNVASETCETLLKGKLINRYFYLYVVDYDRSGEWTGKLFMCTDDKLFTIDGVEKCTDRGYKRTGFFEVDTGEEPSWTVRLEDQSGAEAKGK
jgi:uncharacterized membrane protein